MSRERETERISRERESTSMESIESIEKSERESIERARERVSTESTERESVEREREGGVSRISSE